MLLPLLAIVPLLLATCAAQTLQPTPQASPAPSPAQTAAPEPAPANALLDARIGALLRNPAVAGAHWGIAVTTDDGAPLYSRDADKLFRPASTAKLFTTAAAMALLGPNARVDTTLTYTGTLNADGVLNGYLTLRGAGDGDLSPPPLPGGTAKPDPFAVLDEFAAVVAAKGIHSVTDSVHVDGWLWDPYPEGWAIEDQLWSYGAPVTGLVLNDLSMQLTVVPAAQPGGQASARLSPLVSREAVLANVQTVPKEARTGLLLRRAFANDNLLLVNGTVAPGRPVQEAVAVADPLTFAQSAFLDRLAAHGVHAPFQVPGQATSSDGRSFAAIIHDPVTLPEPAAAGAADDLAVETTPPCNDGCTPLASHRSGPLAEDVFSTLKESKNLHAELMLRRLAVQFGQESTFAQGVRVVRQWVLNSGIAEGDFTLYDGSGLSTKDLVTPRAEAQLLAFAAKQPWFAAWKAALPIGGVDGTLAGRFTQPPLKGHVFAKTGTLGESRALAGFVRCRSGREVIFAILDDNHEPGSAADRVAMDKIVEAIADTN